MDVETGLDGANAIRFTGLSRQRRNWLSQAFRSHLADKGVSILAWHGNVDKEDIAGAPSQSTSRLGG